MEKRRKLRPDIILIASLLFVSALSVALLMILRQPGGFAVVEIDGREYARYPLDTDGEFILGDGSNILVIDDGQAYMKHADCPDRTCVKAGKISHSGESIVCLPNRVNVYITGRRGDVDLVS